MLVPLYSDIGAFLDHHVDAAIPDGGQIDFFIVEQLDGLAPRKDLWVMGSSNGGLDLYTQDGLLLWRSSNYGPVFGERFILLAEDRYVVSAGRYSVMGFEPYW